MNSKNIYNIIYVNLIKKVGKNKKEKRYTFCYFYCNIFLKKLWAQGGS